MNPFLLFVLIGLGMIVAHGLLILTVRSLSGAARRFLNTRSDRGTRSTRSDRGDRGAGA